MLFSSNIFIFLFLPVTLAGYYILPKPVKNIFLLIMSLVFYAWGEPKFVFAMMGSIVFNYAMALLVDRFRNNKNLSRIALIICLAGNIGLLSIFKYLGFITENMIRLGLDIPYIGYALPIGISFFTFQAMSYAIDVYRGDTTVQKKPHNVGLYISIFPALIAGPIIRYKDFEPYINNRSVDFEMFSEGVRRFILGLSKKVLLANNMALIADQAFAMPDAERSVIYAWLGAIAYTFQIFFDFAGYSDMAIGLGKMFGFRFLENFNLPYISKSISEFWRRWHISLGRWFRDYVYFSLGGSRVERKSRLVFNLFITWLLTGIWHGASWNFIVWGLMYFVLITFEKLSGYPQKFRTGLAKSFYRVFTLLCVVGGWVIFRAEGGSAAIGYGLSMLGLSGNPVFSDYVILTFREYWLFLFFAILFSTAYPSKLKTRLGNSDGRILSLVINISFILMYLFCFLWAVSFIVTSAHNPFIYFNF